MMATSLAEMRIARCVQRSQRYQCDMLHWRSRQAGRTRDPLTVRTTLETLRLMTGPDTEAVTRGAVRITLFAAQHAWQHVTMGQGR